MKKLFSLMIIALFALSMSLGTFADDNSSTSAKSTSSSEKKSKKSKKSSKSTADKSSTAAPSK